jgi:hypothetical protein
MVDVAGVMCHIDLFFHCISFFPLSCAIFYPHGLREICITKILHLSHNISIYNFSTT